MTTLLTLDPICDKYFGRTVVSLQITLLENYKSTVRNFEQERPLFENIVNSAHIGSQIFLGELANGENVVLYDNVAAVGQDLAIFQPVNFGWLRVDQEIAYKFHFTQKRQFLVFR